MKNIIIRSVVLIAVFLISFSVISNVMNKDNRNQTGAMEPCTLPSITALCEDGEVNRMYGYTKEMAASYMRDTITPLDKDGKLTVRIDTHGTQLTGIGYEVRSLDTTRLIEDSQVKDWTKEQRTIDVRLNIQDLIEDGTEYILVIKLSSKEQEQICYYTRITRNSELDVQEKLAFVREFHAKTFQKEKGKELVKFIESNSNGSNSDFHYININSSYDTVTWGDMKVQRSGDTVVQIQELNNQTGAFLLRYQVTMENNAKEIEHYNVDEYYRIRYTVDRVYLLDFERTMEQVFEQENAVYYSTSIQLGIANKDISFMTNSEGNVVSFVQTGELYSYDRRGDKISKLFGFMESSGDVREQYDEHEIKIIKVNEDGDTDFIVYGYMNRGQHEGQVGVSVCHYDRKTNSVEEYVFIDSRKPFQHMKEDVGQLAYIGDNKVLYIHLKGNIYTIHTETKKVEILVDNIGEGTFVVSEDNRYVAWQKEQREYDSSNIVLMNLENGKQREIASAENERIRPLGFMGTDFIYGYARQPDITTNATGKVIFPMYQVLIQNEAGEILKQYSPSGFYVSDVEVTENMIRLMRLTDNNRTRNYVEAEEDQIVNSQDEKTNGVFLVSSVTDKKKREYQLDFGVNLKSGNPKRLYPKEIIGEKSTDIQLEQTQEATTYYYVYAKGKMDSMYINASEAISQATKLAGVVVTANQKCIWERTRNLTKTQIMDVNTVAATEQLSSGAACASALLTRRGIQVDVVGLLQQGYSIQSLLEAQLGRENVINMTGTTLENVLYSVGKGYPVLAMSDSSNYVIIVGYNELNTIVMNPQTGKTGYVGMNDSKAMFEAAGNVFLTVIK